jgi:RimJ/RimL family protein N-acetyltransferase
VTVEKMAKIKYKNKVKVWFKKPFKAPDNKHLEIGRFILVNYFGREQLPHLEFEIFEEFKEYRNRGIVSKEIVKYLKLCKKWGHNRLTAIVKDDNFASIRILEKTNFIRINQFKENVCFVIDLEFTKEKLMAMQEVIYEREKFNNQLKEIKNGN